MEKLRKEIVKGKYHFSNEEKQELANRLANKQMDILLLKDEKKSVMSGYKDQLDRLSWETNQLSRGIVDGYEYRDFECTIEKDFDAHLKRYVDVHTGNLIDSRPLDPSDYQQELAV